MTILTVMLKHLRNHDRATASLRWHSYCCPKQQPQREAFHCPAHFCAEVDHQQQQQQQHHQSGDTAGSAESPRAKSAATPTTSSTTRRASDCDPRMKTCGAFEECPPPWEWLRIRRDYCCCCCCYSATSSWWIRDDVGCVC